MSVLSDQIRYTSSVDDSKENSRHTLEIPETHLTSEQVIDKLIKARVNLLINQPFFGNMATRLHFIDATKWCPTAATDGRNFYFNRNFVAALKPAEVLFLVGHEVLHGVYDHLNKKWLGSRIPKLANIAQDYVINLDLLDAGIGEQIQLVEICVDWRFRGKIWEEVYNELYEEADKEGRIHKMQTLDVHIDAAGNNDSKDANDGSEGPIRYSADELDRIGSEVRDAAVQAAKAAGASGKGSLPRGVKRLLDSLINPQLDWRELLAMQIQSVLKNDYSWMTPSRKGLDAGFYMPGMTNDQTIDIAIAIDTSGSISESMLRDFLSEIYGIMGQYTDFNLHLWCFDTQVHNPVKITADTMQAFDDYELAGFGGTLFECNWTYMRENNIEPKKFVMFTDGYPCDGWGDENYCDTLFIVHGSGYGDTPPVAPYGITVPYTRQEMQEAA
jgi:predicted metal-dependent peptidase